MSFCKYNKFVMMVVITATMLFFFSANAFAESYYIDSINSNDDSGGTSIESPWKSLDKVNSIEFKPGDFILFRSSRSWTGQLFPKGSGTDGSPITIDKYGEGELPQIHGNGTTYPIVNSGAVMLWNQDNWIIQNLEITNYGIDNESQRCGILIYNTGEDSKKKNISIMNNVVHDVNSQRSGNKVTGGIIFHSKPYDEDNVLIEGINSEDIGFDNIRVEYNEVYDTDISGIRTGASPNESNNHLKTITNLNFSNNKIRNVLGDGMVIAQAKDSIVENNILENFACEPNKNLNYAGIWAMACENVIFQYNEVYNGKYGYNDGTAYDIDLYCNNVTFQFNYSHNNARGNILFMDGSINSLFQYNISIDDGFDDSKSQWDPIYTNAGAKNIFYLPSKQEYAPIIRNNLFITSERTTDFIRSSSDKRYLVFLNNIILSKNENIQFFTNKNYIANPENQIISNNLYYGFESQLLDKNNIEFLDSEKIIPLLVEPAPEGIENINLEPLGEIRLLSKCGMGETDLGAISVNNNIKYPEKDFLGNLIDIKNPSIGPVEIDLLSKIK